MVQEVQATLWEDKFGKRHTTKAGAERAEAFADLLKAIQESVCYGQMEGDDIPAFIDDNKELIKRYIEAGCAMLKDALA